MYPIESSRWSWSCRYHAVRRIPLAAAVALSLACWSAAASPAFANIIVMDNSDPGFTVLSQTWSVSSATGQFGTNYHYKLTSDSPAGEVEWRPVFPFDGTYEVAVYYRTTGIGRPRDAQYTIEYAGGSDSVTIDQQVNGSTWVVLGTWPFAAGNTGRVRLTSAAEAGKTIVADAVRFRKTQSAAIPRPADMNGDGDVDAADFEAFLPCMAKLPGRLGAACIPADLDGDSDVDLIDFGLFQRCLNEAGHLSDVTCTGTAPIPVRSSNAMTGSQFIADVAGLTVAAREQRVLAEVTAGNVPTFLRAFVPISVGAMLGSPPTLHTVTYYVAPDYLAIGSDEDFIRMPMGPRTAQAIGDAFDCSMPTRKMVNDIYTNCAVQAGAVSVQPLALRHHVGGRVHHEQRHHRGPAGGGRGTAWSTTRRDQEGRGHHRPTRSQAPEGGHLRLALAIRRTASSRSTSATRSRTWITATGSGLCRRKWSSMGRRCRSTTC